MLLHRCCIGALVLLMAGYCQTASAVVTGQYLLEGTAADTSDFGRNGTLVGSPTFVPGLYDGSNSALQLSGAGQSVTLPGDTDFIRNAPGATLMAWVRPDAIESTHTILVVNNGDASAGAGIGAARSVIQISGNQFRALGRQADGGGSSNTVGFTPAINETYFVAGVFDYTMGAIRLYVDGTEVSSTTNNWVANSADTANLVARIGAHADGAQESWQGAIDGARIFNTALSATEIFDIYLAESTNPLLPGDTDGDGVVELEDLTPIRTNYRQSVTMRNEGDLTGDLFVDFADFREWKTAILNGSVSLAGVDLGFLAVPEPTALGLLGFGLMGVGSRIRSRRRSRANCSQPCCVSASKSH